LKKLFPCAFAACVGCSVGRWGSKKIKKSCGASTNGRRTTKHNQLGFAEGKQSSFSRLPYKYFLQMNSCYKDLCE